MAQPWAKLDFDSKVSLFYILQVYIVAYKKWQFLGVNINGIF